MRNSRAARACAVPVLAVALAWALAPAAWAHEEVTVGPLRLEIGFGTEPAYTGQPNSVQILASHGGAPVTHEVDLEVEVSFGDAAVTLGVEPSGEPGDYRAWFVPSQPGDYSFRVRGRIEGQRVDETVTSGPSTFSEVQDPTAAAFPPIEAPSNDELATRIETEAARTDEVVRAASAAADAASSARTAGIVGIVVGAAGVLAALGALMAARRR